MSRRYKQESPLVVSRFLTASVVVMLTCMILIVRLWYVQVFKGDYYVKISENNRIRRIEIPAPRGMIFDRNGAVLLGNRPFFDLVYVPQYVKDKESVLKILSNLLHEPIANFDRMLRSNVGRPEFLPITLKRNLSAYEVSLIESNKVFLPGIEVNVAPRRDYNDKTQAHIVGFMGEIDAKALKTRNEEDPANPYIPGDLIGKHGLELRWEKLLRGKRGYRLIQVDAFGRQTSLFEKEGWELPVKAAVPGADLVLTLDSELQAVASDAFQGKFGAVIVLDPRNGEILAMLSSPTYDPTMYQEGVSQDKWKSLIEDPFKPLFDKTTGGTFAPGSVYKPLIALAALEEGIINPTTKYFCPGHFDLGHDVFHCMQRKGHGYVSLTEALVKSCDVYFYNVGLELGAARIAKYAHALGLGRRLGVQLNREDPGLIPTPGENGMKISVGDTPSIAIGQGANLLTPMQIANLYATIANGGHIWRPFMVKRAINHLGEVLFEHKPELIDDVKIIKPETFHTVAKILEQVVDNPSGTGKAARIPGISVAGKTGSAQVVSLKRNRDRKTSTVSMLWQEHAIFAAFSPAENAEIAVAIVSENDRVGGGGVSSAPVAKKIIEAFWRFKTERKNRPMAEEGSQKDGQKF